MQSVQRMRRTVQAGLPPQISVHRWTPGGARAQSYCHLDLQPHAERPKDASWEVPGTHGRSLVAGGRGLLPKVASNGQYRIATTDGHRAIEAVAGTRRSLQSSAVPFYKATCGTGLGRPRPVPARPARAPRPRAARPRAARSARSSEACTCTPLVSGVSAHAPLQLSPALLLVLGHTNCEVRAQVQASRLRWC